MFNLPTLIQHLLPHHFLSMLAGILAENKFLKYFLIRIFIRFYKIDMNEALITNVNEYSNFNNFFTRKLKTDARPFDLSPNVIVSPADGNVSALGKIAGSQLMQAKGHYFLVHDLLGGSKDLEKNFTNGIYTTVYLSPRDYHRVHMPISGKLVSTIYVPGSLFSVNEATSESVPNLFARNERVICIFETRAGPMCLIFVGAMIVGSIETSWAGEIRPPNNNRKVHRIDYSSLEKPINLAKGDEAGRFKLGSTVILLFGENAVSLDTQLEINDPIKMGQNLGMILNQQE